MENNQFKSGDLVELLSGGPVMTVQNKDTLQSGKDKTVYRCQWFNGKKLEYGNFHEASLKIHTPEK